MVDTELTGRDAGLSGPGIAQVLRFLRAMTKHADVAFDDLFDRYGDVVWVSLPSWIAKIALPAGSGIVLLRDPALIKPFYTVPSETVDRAERGHEMVFGDRSLLCLDGAEHLRLRKLMLPRLRGGALTQWREFIVARAEQEVHGWADESTIDVSPRMHDLSLELILKIVLSVSDSAMSQWTAAIDELVKTATSDQAVMRYALRRVGAVRLWRRFQRASRRCNQLVFDEIARRRGQPELEYNDSLDALLRADGEPLSDKELRDQVISLIAAGHETSAVLASWAIERLVRHPDALAAATAEARGDNEQMPYLDAVLQETLRVRPPIALVSMRSREPITLGEHHFPADTLIVPVIPGVHGSQDLYDEPDSFKPERFLEQPPTTFGHIPWGGGPHRCIGDRVAMFQTTLVLATVLRCVDLAAVDPRDEPIHLGGGGYAPGNGVIVRASRPV